MQHIRVGDKECSEVFSSLDLDACSSTEATPEKVQSVHHHGRPGSKEVQLDGSLATTSGESHAGAEDLSVTENQSIMQSHASCPSRTRLLEQAGGQALLDRFKRMASALVVRDYFKAPKGDRRPMSQAQLSQKVASRYAAILDEYRRTGVVDDLEYDCLDACDGPVPVFGSELDALAPRFPPQTRPGARLLVQGDAPTAVCCSSVVCMKAVLEVR